MRKEATHCRRYAGFKMFFGMVCVVGLVACRSSSPSLALYVVEDKEENQHQNALGDSVSLETLKEKTVLISYWATWCAPCKKEIPELNRLQQQAEMNNWAIIGVNYDGLKGEALEKAVKEMKIQFPVSIEDPGQLLKLKPVEVVPVTFVLSQALKQQQVLLGPQSMETFKKALTGQSESKSE